MFASGFTFVRNAIKLDYPVVQAILSVLPLIDEMIIAVGNCDDGTRELIGSLDPKIRIIDTTWDENLRKGGEVLAKETDKALENVSKDATWCVYIQADECMHEQDYGRIREAMHFYRDDLSVDGFLFNYKHFYGSYDYVGDSRTWYRNEVRIVRNGHGIKSWKDAQGFRKQGIKLKVIALNASVYHYGWVRHPQYQMAKQREAHKLWHTDDHIKQKFKTEELFNYASIDSIKRYTGTHPKVMEKRIDEINWIFDRDPKVKKFSLKNSFLYLIEKWTGKRLWEHKNYKVIA